jgi:fatty acid desaturase
LVSVLVTRSGAIRFGFGLVLVWSFGLVIRFGFGLVLVWFLVHQVTPPEPRPQIFAGKKLQNTPRKNDPENRKMTRKKNDPSRRKNDPKK